MPLTLVLLALGLLGSILMFAGDMLLYFTPGAYDMDGTLRPYMRIMRDVPAGRARLGGVLGPIAAFLYVLGFAGLALTARGEMGWPRRCSPSPSSAAAPITLSTSISPSSPRRGEKNCTTRSRATSCLSCGLPPCPCTWALLCSALP